MTPKLARLFLLGLMSLGAVAHAQEDETPWVYHHAPGAAPLRVEAETAVGTRDARPFGERGVEETLRLAFRPHPRVEIVVSGSTLFVDGGARSGGAVEASVALVRGVRVGGGVAVDLTGTTVARLRADALGTLGRLDLGGTALVEMPIGATGRDAADVMLGVAISGRVSARVRTGVELLGEDLEGLFERDEAEGGARLLAGPTLWLGLARTIDLKLSAAATDVVGQGAGLLARAALGIVF